MPLSERWEAAQLLYGGKVRTFARNSWRQIPFHEQEDVEQELLVVLYDCVIHYDPNRGASFNTFFQRSAKNKVISLIRHYSTKGRKGVAVSLEEESVAAAVDQFLATHSAEELAMFRMEITEYTDMHTEAEWAENRLAKRRVS